jgi:hypothetical protein
VDAQEAAIEVMKYEENHYPKAGEKKLCGHKWPGSHVQEVGHEGVLFNCAEIYQVKREKAIGDVEDQQQDNDVQKPGAVLIHINELTFIVLPAGGHSATAKQQKFQPRSSVRAPLPTLPPVDIFLRFFHKSSQKQRTLKVDRLRTYSQTIT